MCVSVTCGLAVPWLSPLAEHAHALHHDQPVCCVTPEFPQNTPFRLMQRRWRAQITLHTDLGMEPFVPEDQLLHRRQTLKRNSIKCGHTSGPAAHSPHMSSHTSIRLSSANTTACLQLAPMINQITLFTHKYFQQGYKGADHKRQMLKACYTGLSHAVKPTAAGGQACPPLS